MMNARDYLDPYDVDYDDVEDILSDDEYDYYQATEAAGSAWYLAEHLLLVDEYADEDDDTDILEDDCA